MLRGRLFKGFFLRGIESLVPVCTFAASACLKFLVLNLLNCELMFGKVLGSIFEELDFNLCQTCGRYDCWFSVNLDLRTAVFLDVHGKGSVALCNWH